MVHHVYILRCVDESLYIGTAKNLEARLKAHNDGQGAAYTFKHRPVRLVHSESYPAEREALARERQLKHWSRAKKESLIAGDLERLKHLSKRRS
jgi:predicted GIY-YIG superfamily endonuclease